MKKLSFILCLGVSLLCLRLLSQEPIHLLGVNIPRHLTINHQDTLQLNGYGIGTIEKVPYYVGALYATSQQTTANGLLSADYPLVMRYYFVKDDIDAELLKLMMIESILINNSGWESQEFVQQQLQALQMALADEINAGDVLTFYYSPVQGTFLLLNEKVLHHWPHARNFFNMLLKTWIGDFPPNREFKKGILGNEDAGKKW